MNDLKIGDFVWFSYLSSPLGDYTEEDYINLLNGFLKIEKIINRKIKFYGIEKEYNLQNCWGFCPFKKDIHYTRKMKITKLLKN